MSSPAASQVWGGRALRAGSPLRLSLQSFILRSKKGREEEKGKRGEEIEATPREPEHCHHSHLQPSCVYYFKNNLFNRNSCVSGPRLRIPGSRPLLIIISIIKMLSGPGGWRTLAPAPGLSGSPPSGTGSRGARWGWGCGPPAPTAPRRGEGALRPPGAARAGPTEGAGTLGPPPRAGFAAAPYTMGSKQSEARKTGAREGRRIAEPRARASGGRERGVGALHQGRSRYSGRGRGDGG